MKQYVTENRTESFSPIYKEFKLGLSPHLEIDNLLSQILVPHKYKTIQCNSLFAEETINFIIDYFNEQSRLDTDFKQNILKEISNTPFPHHIDSQKLKEKIEVNSENSFVSSAKGMKNILDAFIKYNDFTTNLSANYFEDIDYVIEPINEVYDSTKI